MLRAFVFLLRIVLYFQRFTLEAIVLYKVQYADGAVYQYVRVLWTSFNAEEEKR